MADDELQRFEAMLGAISKITSGNEEVSDQLAGARCPKCNASSFVKISELHEEALRGAEEQSGESAAVRAGGITDRQILAKFSPPQRRSPVGGALLVGAAFAVVAVLLYRRFGATGGQLGAVAAIVAAAVMLMTRARRFSDEYYARRQRWNKLYMCRSCGQLVAQ
ncbi:MAG: hypothetical protein JWM41_1746 [Gemmatimonadetes bacterium]|nr:hypothetical protein [Gemmatimonadota bacterium]